VNSTSANVVNPEMHILLINGGYMRTLGGKTGSALSPLTADVVMNTLSQSAISDDGEYRPAIGSAHSGGAHSGGKMQRRGAY
jgi:hypothetical protein